MDIDLKNYQAVDFEKDLGNKKNFKYHDIFGSAPLVPIKSLGRVQALINSPLAKQENLLYQLTMLSCVHLHIAMLNQHNSWFNDKNEVKLSWAMTYALANFIKGKGTSINEALGFVKNIGQCQDKLFPQDYAHQLGEENVHNKKLVTEEMKEDASHWRINGWSWLDDLSINSIYESLTHTLILVGVTLNYNWDNPVIVSNVLQTNHLSLIIDILDKDNVDIVSGFTGNQYSESDYGSWIIWEGFKKDKLDLRVLRRDAAIGLAVSVRDIPDDKILELNKKNKSMLELIMCSKHPEELMSKKIFSLDKSNRIHHYADEITYKELVSEEMDFSFVRDVSYEEFQTFKVGVPVSWAGISVIDFIKFQIKHGLIKADE